MTHLRIQASTGETSAHQASRPLYSKPSEWEPNIYGHKGLEKGDKPRTLDTHRLFHSLVASLCRVESNQTKQVLGAKILFLASRSGAASSTPDKAGPIPTLERPLEAPDTAHEGHRAKVSRSGSDHTGS